MGFRYMSDLHGVIPEGEYLEDTLLLAGDVAEFGGNSGSKLLGLLTEICEKYKEVIFVPGNHEYYGTNIGSLESKIREGMAEVSNFTLLQNAEYVDVGDVRIFGATLWSDVISILNTVDLFMNDYRYIRIGPPEEPWKRKIKPADTLSIHRDHVKALNDALSEYTDKCIVVTHHSPSTKSTAAKYTDNPLNPAYSTDIELVRWPNIWIHGHTHTSFDYEHNGSRILCNPKGYGFENPAFSSFDNYFEL